MFTNTCKFLTVSILTTNRHPWEVDFLAQTWSNIIISSKPNFFSFPHTLSQKFYPFYLLSHELIHYPIQVHQFNNHPRTIFALEWCWTF